MVNFASLSINAGAVVGWVADSLLRTSGMPGLPRALLYRKRGSFEDRLAQITSQLEESAVGTQVLLDEMQQAIAQRSKAVAEVQRRVEELRAQEIRAREEIAQLENVKPEAAQAINTLVGDALDQRDKRSAKRDLVIFLLGVLASVVVGVLIQVGYGLYVGDISAPIRSSKPTPTAIGSHPAAASASPVVSPSGVVSASPAPSITATR